MAIIGTFGIPSLVIIVLARFRHNQNMELIRHGINPDNTLPAYPGNKSLFFGFLFTGIGIALIIAKLIAGGFHDLAGGIVLFGSGIAFLTYWKLTATDRDHQRRLYGERFGIGTDPDEKNDVAPLVRDDMEKFVGK